MSPTKPKRDDLLTAAAIAPDMQSIAPRTVVRPIKTFFFRQRILSLRFPVMMAAAKTKHLAQYFSFLRNKCHRSGIAKYVIRWSRLQTIEDVG